jgi:YidC/Oxa1 family membrane protein insertase
MNNRFLLYAAYGLVVFMIWQQWTIENSPVRSTVQSEESISSELNETNDADIPEAGISKAKKERKVSGNNAKKGQFFKISNSNIELTVSSIGGDIVESRLLNFREKAEIGSNPISLFTQKRENYIAQSGLIHEKTDDSRQVAELAPNHHDDFKLLKLADRYVELIWQDKSKKIKVLKKITLKEDDFVADISYEISNNSSKDWVGRAYNQLRRSKPTEGRSWITPSFFGAAFYEDDSYKKVSFDEISDSQMAEQISGGWVAMMQHYFVSAWAGKEGENSLFYTKEIKGKNGTEYSIGMRSEPIFIEPEQTANFSRTLFVGPKLQKNLEKVSPGLDLTVDYGMLTFLSKPLFWLLDKIYSFTANWGWSIILLTILIKVLFYKLSETSYRSMAKMKKFTPKIQTIRERYADDRQKLNQAMLEMYKQEKINPLGGCWPILIQIPVFIALYWVLLESVEMRHAPFILWIDDLSSKDPFYVLPLLMGVSMYIQQKLNPTPPDPVQAKVMQFLPIIFTAFFAFFPSGLVLYWVANNILSIAQQWKIVRTIEGK